MDFKKDTNKVYSILEKKVISDRSKVLSQKTKEGMAKAKREGRVMGRPSQLSSRDVREILSLIDTGISYSKIAIQYGISKMMVSKIKQEGISRCEMIDRARKYKEAPLALEEDNQTFLQLNTYADRLKSLLKTKHNVDLTINDCYLLLYEVLTESVKPDPSHNNFWEYNPPQAYVELTTHILNKQKN